MSGADFRPLDIEAPSFDVDVIVSRIIEAADELTARTGREWTPEEVLAILIEMAE